MGFLYRVRNRDADRFVVRNDDLSVADQNIIGVDVDIVVDIAVQLHNGAATEFEQLVDA